jgi:FdhD protein
MTGRTARRRELRVALPGGTVARADLLVAEEQLGIRIGGAAVTLTMRTPGDDIDLATGFLVSEGCSGRPPM